MWKALLCIVTLCGTTTLFSYTLREERTSPMLIKGGGSYASTMNDIIIPAIKTKNKDQLQSVVIQNAGLQIAIQELEKEKTIWKVNRYQDFSSFWNASFAAYSYTANDVSWTDSESIYSSGSATRQPYAITYVHINPNRKVQVNLIETTSGWKVNLLQWSSRVS